MTNITASRCHTRTMHSEYTPPAIKMSKNELLVKINEIAEEMKQSWEANDGWTEIYDGLSRTRGSLQNKYNSIEREEMRQWRNEQEAKRQTALNNMPANDDSQRPCTFGEFDAEWD